MLSSHDLVTRVPLERSANGHRMIQADKDDVELLGYLKLDVLGVRMLSSMRHAVDEIARTTGEKVDLDRSRSDDPATFELIRRSDTLGCFQIESPGQRELLQKLQPTRWEDLIVDISLFRPGPVKSDMIAPYLRRRAGMEPPTYVHPGLRAPLQETYGVIVFHEQVIRTLAAMAGYSETTADHIRRHLDDEEMLPGFREDFLRRTAARGVEPAAAERTWDAVIQFASFGFCKAHAAAFAVPTYQSSWLKAHYPAHLMAGLLTYDPGMYPRRLIVEDARQHGIPILPLDVNASEPEYTVEPAPPPAGDGAFGIRLGLQDVAGSPTPRSARSCRRARTGRSPTWATSCAGRWSAAGRRGPRARRCLRPPAGREPPHASVPGHDDGGRARGRPAHARRRRGAPAHAAEGLLRRRGREGRARGPGRRRHPAHRDLLRAPAARPGRHAREGPAGLRGGRHVMVAGVKVASQTPAIRSGQRIIFLTLDDATGPVEITVFEGAQTRSW